MLEALREAKKAYLKDEVPVGAVIVKDGKIIARAHNKKEEKNQATRHAEIEVIEKASKKLNNWYLSDCDLYVTFEPCLMCCGAIINSRIDSVYFGAYDYKYGCCGSIMNVLTDNRFNHHPTCKGGILEKECSKILTEFFQNKRQEKKELKK